MRFSQSTLIVAALTTSTLAAAPVLAQTTSGQISGQVVDPRTIQLAGRITF